MKTFLSVDRRLLNPQAIENVELKVAVPTKDTKNNPLFIQDMPWEIRIDNGYPNVIYDSREQIFHCYYTLFIEDKDTEGTTLQERTQRNYRPRMDRVISLAYARSKDGIHWGELIPWPEYNPQADSHNFPFWNEEEQCYMLISRIWKDGIRVTTISHSQDFIHWSEPIEMLRGRGYENQIYSMPVFKAQDLYMGLASIIHEGDRTKENFDCVDCELTWSADGKKFDFEAMDQPVIPRGTGHYPDGEFDNSCIYASSPVTDGQKVWVYYMGGNGQHTNFRESSLGRAYWEVDKFACWTGRKEGIESILTTTTLTLSGDYVEVLADVVDTEKDWELAASVHPVWTENAYEGLRMEEAVAEKSGRWIRISWKGEKLPDKSGCIRFKFKNLKIWAVRGEMEYKGHRLWEGADMENEGM